MVRDNNPVSAGAGALGSIAARAVHAVTERVQSLVPTGDLDARDTDYIREGLPGLWLLASRYFRADVQGLHHIPREGPVLLVGNHSGGITTPDTFVFTLAFSTYFGVERLFFQLAHNLVVSSPLGMILRRYGTVAANSRNTELALRAGAAVLVYPGGDHEVFRPSWEQGTVNFGGRRATCGSRWSTVCRSSPSSPSAARRPHCFSPVARPWRVSRELTACSG